MTSKKSKDAWRDIYKDSSKKGIYQSFHSSLLHDLAKDEYSKTARDNYVALANTVRDRLVERWLETKQAYHDQNGKRVYYLSLEFLIGRLLSNYMLNLGLDESCEAALKEMGLDIREVLEEEVDAGLGNGGLGRLAACFLDSMATLGIPACGYGIRYDYGIFHQKIVNGYQVEQPDEWLKDGNPWEFARPEYSVDIQFYGRTELTKDERGHVRFEWKDTQNIVAMPYDIPTPGYKNDVINTLRLWSARSSEEFDLKYFNDGDYEKAVYDKMYSENISRVLYPNDASSVGRELRLKQEYFFTAASIADIIRRFKYNNSDLNQLPEKVAIQLNDTHPALAVVEFLRVLIDVEGLGWDEAWNITLKTFAYTNHTLLPEALEAWSVPLFQNLLPRHMQLIYEINARFLKEVETQFPNDPERLGRMSLIDEGGTRRVRMAYLAIVGSHAVNGVSELHSQLLRENLFKDFFELWPERFQNKTNGITPRRWLLKANPALTKAVSGAIGDDWTHDFNQLKKLEAFASDSAFQKKWQRIKQKNKKVLSDYIQRKMNIKVDPRSLFDVQIKRIHEYKRQTLFAFYILSQYLKAKDNPSSISVPRTFIFGGKAAPGYHMAKLIIKFITSIADVVNHDKQIKDRLKVVFLENYRVSLAEMIFPASDLSEQISTGGTEASGTGCMKFMINGALTVGTWDGANIEMAQEMGAENMFTFGLKADEVAALKGRGYHPQDYIARSPMLEEIFHRIQDNQFSPNEPGVFNPLIENLMGTDPFLVCADFEDYCRIQQVISENFLDTVDWTKKAILNLARAGKFSSDRTIQEYADDIWHVSHEKSFQRA